MGQSISVVTVAFQLQPCALWWLILMCDHRVPTEQLEIHYVQGNYLHPSWHYDGFDKCKLFYRTKHLFKGQMSADIYLLIVGGKCPFCLYFLLQYFCHLVAIVMA